MCIRQCLAWALVARKVLHIALWLGGPEEDHQLHHCCWTGRVSEREEEEKAHCYVKRISVSYSQPFIL